MGSRRSGGLLLVVAALGGALVGGCAHGRTGSYEPTPAATQACAGVVPLSVLVGPPVPETAVARGQALYCLALYEPALSVLADEAIRRRAEADAIDEAMASPASPGPPPLAADRLPALRWIVYLHRRFPGWQRINITVGEVSRSDLDAPSSPTCATNSTRSRPDSSTSAGHSTRPWSCCGRFRRRAPSACARCSSRGRSTFVVRRPCRRWPRSTRRCGSHRWGRWSWPSFRWRASITRWGSSRPPAGPTIACRRCLRTGRAPLSKARGRVFR